DGLVHDAVVVPVDGVGERGARWEPGTGPERERERLVAGGVGGTCEAGTGEDPDVRLRGREAGLRLVGDGKGLPAGRRQGGTEVVRAIVGGRERVVGGQRGLAVRAGDVDRAGVVHGLVAVVVVGGD